MQKRGSPLPERISKRLRLPLIAAPMLRVSGPDLVIAACRNGVIGSFPTANARTVDQLDEWFTRMRGELGDLGEKAAPICPNLIIRRPDLKEHLASVLRHKIEIVITSVGSPAPVIGPLHDAGALVLADIATLRHAEKAIDAGADGLILLTAGAGGQTGWLNPFAFVRAVRAMFDGPIVLAGGVSDGVALHAAHALGCDLAYMGTRFIATNESMAPQAYKEMLVSANMDDVLLTRAFTGLETNMLRPSIEAVGLDPKRLDEQMSEERANAEHGSGGRGPKRWSEVWSAGHTVSGVRDIVSADILIDRIAREYEEAKAKR